MKCARFENCYEKGNSWHSEISYSTIIKKRGKYYGTKT